MKKSNNENINPIENHSYEEKPLELGITLEESSHGNFLLPLFSISERLKKGFADIIQLREGLKLIINNYTPRKTTEVKFSIETPPLEFVFCLSGKAEVTLDLDEFEKKFIKFTSGMNTVFYFPKTRGSIKFYSDNSIKILSLHISPDFLKTFIDSDYSGLPDEFIKIIEGQSSQSFIQNNQISASMQVAVTQMFETKLKGAAKKMFLESKALELMSLQLAQLIQDKSETNVSYLSDNDLNSIKKIQLYLQDNFSSPLSLSELAKSAGISHTKLNLGFKAVYGSTVFEYIRKIRLENSLRMLEEKKLSITEISYEAGWSSPSHFSKEFIKHYKISPKKYQLLKRNV